MSRNKDQWDFCIIPNHVQGLPALHLCQECKTEQGSVSTQLQIIIKHLNPEGFGLVMCILGSLRKNGDKGKVQFHTAIPLLELEYSKFVKVQLQKILLIKALHKRLTAVTVEY